MFEYLNGIIKIKKPEYLGIDVNGVGYRVYITLKTYDNIQVGEKKELYIYNIIKEDTFKLVGFLEERERIMFEMLIGISGIGLSLALSIMSTFTIENIREIVSTENFVTLKKVPKLGEKKSKQIIIDLNNKIKTLNLMSIGNLAEISLTSTIEDELYLALESLGYSKKEIGALVTKEELASYTSLEVAIKSVLKKMNMK